VTDRVEGILLAAGESRRMGFPKPLLRLDGETFVEHAARAMLAAVDRVIVVVGAHREGVRPAIPHDARIAVVENPDWPAGQLSSIKAGLAAVSPEASAALIHLVDHPAVKGSTFRSIVGHYRRTRAAVAIARHAGRRGHPVLFDRALFAEIMAAPAEEGARAVVNAVPSRVVYVDVDDPGITLDLDTPGDLAAAGIKPPDPAGR
jgi:CTP:molybdopterin cytidylyltransferase MocA